jgi:general secretion pathway protein D
LAAGLLGLYAGDAIGQSPTPVRASSRVPQTVTPEQAQAALRASVRPARAGTAPRQAAVHAPTPPTVKPVQHTQAADGTGESPAEDAAEVPSLEPKKQPPPRPRPRRSEEIAAPRGQKMHDLLDSVAEPLVSRRDEPLEKVEFNNVTVTEAAKLLSDQSDLKIVPSQDAGKVVISLYLKNVRPGVVVDAITKGNGLFYREDPETGIIRIYTTGEYEKDLGSFREERTEVFTLLYPNPLDVAYAIQGAFGDRVMMSVNGWQVDSQQIQDISQRFARLNLVDQQNRVSGGFLNQAGSFGGQTGGIGNIGGIGGVGGGGGGIGGIGGIGGGIGGLGGGLGGVGGGYGGGGAYGFGGFGDVGGFGGFGAMTGQNGYNNRNGQNGTQAGDPPKKLENLTPDQIQALDRALQTNNQTVIDELLRSRHADIFVTAVPRNNQLIVRTADLSSMQKIAELVSQLDVPTPLVLLEVKVLALALGDDFRSAFDYQFSDGKLVSGVLINNVTDFTTGGNILPPAADIGGPQREEPLAPGPLGTQPNQNFTFQIVSSNFRARMQLLESKNRVTQLATPMLLTANNEASRIFIGRTIPIVVGYNAGIGVGATVVDDGVGGTTVGSSAPITPVTQLRDIGQSLLITPNINADRTVTLRVAQESSELDGTTTIPIISGNTQFNPEIDVVRRTTVSGTVVAKDACTVAIGGLIQEDLTDTRSGVPILGKLPIVGILFRGQATGRSRTELVVMIRPYVFNTPQESAKLSYELMQELSIHPESPDPIGTLDSFAPHEVLQANPPQSPLQTIFRLHSLEPKAY